MLIGKLNLDWQASKHSGLDRNCLYTNPTYSVMPIKPWPSGKVCRTDTFGEGTVGSSVKSVLTLMEVRIKSLLERTAIFSMKWLGGNV